VRYLVQGSVRRAGERVRIAVELVDAVDGRCLWAERYDFDLDDVFAVQDRIAARIAGSVEPELLKSETEVLTRRRGGSASAWDLVARGCSYFHQITGPTHRKARELFLQARQLDPELAEAWIWLARVDAGILAFGWNEDAAEIRREGLAAAHEAVRRDEKNCYAHYSLAIMGVMSDSFDLAIRAAEKAVEVSPSFALGHLVLGMAHLYSGNAESAILPLEQGLALNRHDPHNFVWYNILALSQLYRGESEAGLRQAEMSLKIRPQWRSAMETLAACCAELGKVDAAREWREQLAELTPAPGDALQPLWRRNPAWAARMQAWLAG
jgi:tetratricopeptide (TPR) repeat protein